jgi:hypothetical protein
MFVRLSRESDGLGALPRLQRRRERKEACRKNLSRTGHHQEMPEGENQKNGGTKMQQRQMDPRIAKLFGGDRFWSLTALGLLWLLYAFVFFEVYQYTAIPAVTWSLAIGGGLVLLFNTASIFAMVAHLSEDRSEIYGLDLYYLDLANKQSSQ